MWFFNDGCWMIVCRCSTTPMQQAQKHEAQAMLMQGVVEAIVDGGMQSGEFL